LVKILFLEVITGTECDIFYYRLILPIFIANIKNKMGMERSALKKTFVLDTNVLLQTPFALYSFGDNDVVIPEVVLEELDKFKKDNTELGANARHAARILDELRTKGNLKEGVKLENGGMLRVESNYSRVKLPESWDDSLCVLY